jgi:hypothetical protein
LAVFGYELDAIMKVPMAEIRRRHGVVLDEDVFDCNQLQRATPTMDTMVHLELDVDRRANLTPGAIVVQIGHPTRRMSGRRMKGYDRAGCAGSTSSAARRSRNCARTSALNRHNLPTRPLLWLSGPQARLCPSSFGSSQIPQDTSVNRNESVAVIR